MARKHNTIVMDRVALGAAAAAVNVDLPINPISFLTLSIRALNNAASTVPSLIQALTKLGFLEVLLAGKTLFGASALDCAALQYALWRTEVSRQPVSKTDNNIFNFSIHIPFGRQPWNPLEALPATRRGDLSFRISHAADASPLDTFTLTLEARQILDVDPVGFLKIGTNTKTPTATGDHEVDLVVGPDYIGALLFGTTVPTAAAQTASIAKVKLLVDDLEQYYPETRWESLWAEWFINRNTPFAGIDHTHVGDVAAAYTQFQLTGGAVYDANHLRNYAYLDFDPMDDPEASYRLKTRGRSRAHMRITADVADLIRVLPVELVSLVPTEG